MCVPLLQLLEVQQSSGARYQEEVIREATAREVQSYYLQCLHQLVNSRPQLAAEELLESHSNLRKDGETSQPASVQSNPHRERKSKPHVTVQDGMTHRTSASGGRTQGTSASGGRMQGTSASGGRTQGTSASGGRMQGTSASGGRKQGTSASGGRTQGTSASGERTQGTSASGGRMQGTKRHVLGTSVRIRSAASSMTKRTGGNKE